MGNDARTLGKWRRGKGSEASKIFLDDPQGGPSKTVTELWYGGWTPAEISEHAAFIIKACNAHDALVAACKGSLAEIDEHWCLLRDTDKADDWEMMQDQLRRATALATEANDD